MNTNLYKQVGDLNPRKSLFDLSYDKLFDCNMGELIPICHDEYYPGDVVSYGSEMVIRFQPLNAPILHEINAKIHYFFVPYRLLWDSWEDFITGGVDGDDASVLPKWDGKTAQTVKYSLWDYLGWPVGLNLADDYEYSPMDFPRNAYNFIYNEWYRDETNMTELALTSSVIRDGAWEKDYFTSCLPWQQRGTAPALPISGSIPVTGIGAQNTTWTTGPTNVYETDGTGTTAYANYKNVSNDADNQRFLAEEDPNNAGYPNIRVDLGGATTFDVADLRLVFQIQKWLERNARAGVRLQEFIKGHFGVDAGDHRLDRPEYLGGSKQSVVISEVLQTSENGATPQGNLAGHGLSVNGQHVFKYRVKEHGLIMGILCVKPRTTYSQGINRQWLRTTKYDFYSPEFQGLSEQAVLKAELYMTGSSANDGAIFGYQGHWDEMRTKQSMYCGAMRDDLAHWHCGRIFGSSPSLNSTFLQCNPSTRIFADEVDPGVIVHISNKIYAYRPLTAMSNPGYIDH